MLPSSLTAASFQQYSPEARQIAMSHVKLFQQMPLGFLPSLLQQLIEYEFKFPSERVALSDELAYLSSLSPNQLTRLFQDFAHLQLAADQNKLDWVNQPLAFSEQFSAYLWTSHQMDAFQTAAATYGDQLQAKVPPHKPALPRLGIAVIGAGVSSYSAELFTRLRPHGTYFSNVQPVDGLNKLLTAAKSRAANHPSPYAHWYVDGGELMAGSDSLSCVSYTALAPSRKALLSDIQHESSKPGAGPESLRNYMAHLQPERLGLSGDRIIDRFQMKLLTEGSGTQIFSTTFAQWTAREVLRRTSALTLLVRFAPRQRQRPMNELLANQQTEPELDPIGSLIDADMAAYYHWINQGRLPGHEEAVFLVWFEGHRQALAIGPTLTRGVESKSSIDLEALLALCTANKVVT